MIRKITTKFIELEISPAEAATGGEKDITYKKSDKAKKLLVKIPSEVKPRTKIRLKGVGAIKGKGMATSTCT